MKPVIAILLLLPLQVFCQQVENDFDFSIFFGNCFNSDSINLNINGRRVILNQKLQTNPVGYAGCNVVQFRENLVTNCMDSAKKHSRVPARQILKLAISINDSWSYQDFDMNNGKYILVEFCDIEDQKNKKIIIKQMKLPPEFLTKK